MYLFSAPVMLCKLLLVLTLFFNTILCFSLDADIELRVTSVGDILLNGRPPIKFSDEEDSSVENVFDNMIPLRDTADGMPPLLAMLYGAHFENHEDKEPTTQE